MLFLVLAVAACLAAFGDGYFYRSSTTGKVEGFKYHERLPEGHAVLLASPVTDPETLSPDVLAQINECVVDTTPPAPTDYEHAVDVASAYVQENSAMTDEAKANAAKNNEDAKRGENRRKGQEAARKAAAGKNNAQAKRERPAKAKADEPAPPPAP